MNRPQHNLERYNNLKTFIDSESFVEHQCREFLQYIPHILFRETVINFIYVEKEYKGNSGDSDYIISAEVKDGSGLSTVRAYIWELKAPQCNIFEFDNKNRLIPSKYLIEAENQLLHYHYEHRGSDQFKDEFKVTHPDNVMFGGIIIGSGKTSIKCRESLDQKDKKLFEKAVKVRQKYLYDINGIKLLTWDYILEQFLPSITNPIRHSIPNEFDRVIASTPLVPKDIHIDWVAKNF